MKLPSNMAKTKKLFGLKSLFYLSMLAFFLVALNLLFTRTQKPKEVKDSEAAESLYLLTWQKDCTTNKVKLTKTTINGVLAIKSQCLRKDNTVAWSQNCKGYVDSATSRLNQNYYHVTCFEPTEIRTPQPSYSYVPDWSKDCSSTTEIIMNKPYEFGVSCKSTTLAWSKLCNGLIRTSKKATDPLVRNVTPTPEMLSNLCLKISN